MKKIKIKISVFLLFAILLLITACEKDIVEGELRPKYKMTNDTINEVAGKKIERLGYEFFVFEETMAILELHVGTDNHIEESIEIECRVTEHDNTMFGFSLDAMADEELIELMIDFGNTRKIMTVENFIIDAESSHGSIGDEGYVTNDERSIVEYVYEVKDESGNTEKRFIKMMMKVE